MGIQQAEIIRPEFVEPGLARHCEPFDHGLDSSAPGYPGLDMTRTQPFCVIGNEAQPFSTLALNQLVAGVCSE